MPVTIARLFNTCGPRQSDRYGMVLPTFVRQALRGRPLTVFGDGTQRRCFCDVADVVPALMQLIEHPGARGRVFNLGSQREISIVALAERVKRLVGSASEVVRIPYDEAWDEQFEDMVRRVPDLTRISGLIGFTARIALDTTIAAVIAYERERMTTAGASAHPPLHPPM